MKRTIVIAIITTCVIALLAYFAITAVSVVQILPKIKDRMALVDSIKTTRTLVRNRISLISVDSSHPLEIDLSKERHTLHLWATWCKPCIAEMGSILDYTNTHPGQSIYLVSFEPLDSLKTFVESRNWSGPFYKMEKDSFPLSISQHIFPSTFHIDSARVTSIQVGATKW